MPVGGAQLPNARLAHAAEPGARINAVVMILMILMMLTLVSRANLNTMEGADIFSSPSLCAGLT